MDNTELKEKRKRLGLSIRQVSRIIGYSEHWISQFELGEKRISARFIQEYSDGLTRYKNILKKGK